MTIKIEISDDVRRMAQRLAQQLEMREFIALGVESVEYAYAAMRAQGTQWWVEGEAFLEKAKALGYDVNPASLPNAGDGYESRFA